MKENCVCNVSLSKVLIFPNIPTRNKKKKSLSKFSTDKFAKNNTELNNRALIQCDNAGSAFQLEIYPFAGIIWRILQETNEL